jgi:putative glutamine amidotransferase
MYKKKPVIGITTAYDFDRCSSWIREDYYEAVTQSGGIPVLIPATEDKSIWASYLDVCDGIILSGGPDVDAAYFGKNNLPCTNEISPVRDSMETYIARSAIDLDKPLLGICRGIQVLNIAAGGSIFQDIYEENITGKQLIKHSQQAPRWFEIHNINIIHDTYLYSIYKENLQKVNSFHHQAVSEVAPDFTVDAYADDGIIEAISHRNRKFIIGVQWHPENLFKRDDSHRKLFERLITVC